MIERDGATDLLVVRREAIKQRGGLELLHREEDLPHGRFGVPLHLVKVALRGVLGALLARFPWPRSPRPMSGP